METYHKIQSVYKRDPDTNYKTFLEGQFSLPEFEYLKDAQWTWREKVDGTNIRIQFDPLKVMSDNILDVLQFKGKTDKADLPKPLVKWLESRREQLTDKMLEMFQQPVCIYGEGYGGKIQKKSNIYGAEQRFVAFDIKIGNQWLQRSDVEEITKNLGLDIVPITGKGTLLEMVDIVKQGLRSMWNPTFNAEGIVAIPAVELLSTRGYRLITKVKERDFPEL